MSWLISLLFVVFNFCAGIFGASRDERGRVVEHRVWAHWSNENEDRVTRTKGAPYRGRAWLYAFGFTLGFEWNLWSRSCGISANIDGSGGGDHDVTLGVRLPPVAMWLSLSGAFRRLPRFDAWWTARYRYGSRTVEASIHDAIVWWRMWTDPNEWHSKTPRWREGNFKPLDVILGRERYREQTLSEHDVLIPMPEGGYPAKVALRLDTWARPRWFAKSLLRASVDVPIGVPHQGKGENSYDCGEDALFGWGGPCATLEGAIASTVESVLKSRRRYDGDAMAEYPPPVARQALHDAREAARATPPPAAVAS